MAAPSKYNFEICEEICARVSEGENIKKVLALLKGALMIHNSNVTKEAVPVS